jgi:hypothetical protein
VNALSSARQPRTHGRFRIPVPLLAASQFCARNRVFRFYVRRAVDSSSSWLLTSCR